jgi:hypothetical protein
MDLKFGTGHLFPPTSRSSMQLISVSDNANGYSEILAILISVLSLIQVKGTRIPMNVLPLKKRTEIEEDA